MYDMYCIMNMELIEMKSNICISIESELIVWFKEYCIRNGTTVSGQVETWMSQLHKKVSNGDINLIEKEVEQDGQKKATTRRLLEERLEFSSKCGIEGEHYLRWTLNPDVFDWVCDEMERLGYSALEIDRMEERWNRWKKESEEKEKK